MEVEDRTHWDQAEEKKKSLKRSGMEGGNTSVDEGVGGCGGGEGVGGCGEDDDWDGEDVGGADGMRMGTKGELGGVSIKEV